MMLRPPALRKSAVIGAVVMAFVLLSASAYFRGVPVSAALAPSIVTPTINGAIDTNNTGHEAFWSQIPALQVPLTASNDFGGSVKSVSLKMGNNGTHILVYATWGDPTSSRTKNDVVEDPNNAGLFYANASFYYEDRIVIWWSLNQNPGPPPCMQKSIPGHGEGESLAGTGNLWHWKAARGDSLGASYGTLKYNSGPLKGQFITAPHSFANNEFINTTGHYQLGWDQYPTKTAPGNFTIGFGESNVPYNTFLVYAHGVWDATTHMYTWEAARSLHTTPTLHTVQFSPGATYYFAVGVFDGGPIPIPAGVPHQAGWNFYGENEETKSVSSWNTMSLGPSGGAATTVASSITQALSTITTTQPAATSSPGGITFETAAVASFAMLLVGFIAGVAIVSRFAVPKK